MLLRRNTIVKRDYVTLGGLPNTNGGVASLGAPHISYACKPFAGGALAKGGGRISDTLGLAGNTLT
jgi:hypothetical protein